MTMIVLRSFCCGVAAAVVSVPLFFFTMIWWAMRNLPPAPGGETGGGEVGWDLITIGRSGHLAIGAWLLVAFAIGFSLGFRYFSKRSFPQALESRRD
jgi:hypothetical protein